MGTHLVGRIEVKRILGSLNDYAIPVAIVLQEILKVWAIFACIIWRRCPSSKGILIFLTVFWTWLLTKLDPLSLLDFIKLVLDFFVIHHIFNFILSIKLV